MVGNCCLFVMPIRMFDQQKKHNSFHKNASSYIRYLHKRLADKVLLGKHTDGVVVRIQLICRINILCTDCCAGKNWVSFLPLATISANGYCHFDIASVCPSVCLSVGPSVHPEWRHCSNSLRISAISLKFGGMMHSTMEQIAFDDFVTQGARASAAIILTLTIPAQDKIR